MAPLIVSVVIVNWKVRDLLRDCLRSLHGQMQMAREAFEVIVVDNDSRDGSREMLAAEFPTTVVLPNAENVGFGRASNQALPSCRGRYVLLLNPDTLVLDHAVDRMVSLMDERPRLAALGCRLLNSDGSFQRWTGGNPPGLLNVTCHFLLLYRLLPGFLLPRPLYLEGEPARDVEVGWVSGACMLLRRDALGERIFDERFFLYGEDLELCERLREAGWSVVYTPGAQVVHHQGRSLEQQEAQVQTSKLRSLRDLFARRRGGAWLAYYDLVVATGFLLRSLVYGTAELLRPGQGYRGRAAQSRLFLTEAVRLLFTGSGPA